MVQLTKNYITKKNNNPQRFSPKSFYRSEESLRVQAMQRTVIYDLEQSIAQSDPSCLSNAQTNPHNANAFPRNYAVNLTKMLLFNLKKWFLIVKIA
jgi:hypothetical protein